MSHCCKSTQCSMKCCSENGDCSSSMADCVYFYGGDGGGSKDKQQN